MIMAAIGLWFVLAIAFLQPPSEEQINKCVEASNYTYDRCVFELTR